MTQQTEIKIPEQLIGNAFVLENVRDLKLPRRIKNALISNNLFYVIDVLSKKQSSLLKMHNFSHKSYSQMITVFQEHGLTFPIDHTAIASIIEECWSEAKKNSDMFMANLRAVLNTPEKTVPRIKQITPQTTPISGTITIDGRGHIQCALTLSPILNGAVEEGIIKIEQLNETFRKGVGKLAQEAAITLKGNIADELNRE